jgi:hypothetical protein
VSDNAKQVMGEIKTRRDDRRTAWEEVIQPYLQAVQARADHVAHALRFIEEARRGKALGRLGGAVVFQGAILAGGSYYPMYADVRAKVLRAGNMATSQGWVVTTQTDVREIHIVVSCEAWEFNVMPQVGATTPTHLLIGMTNSVYKWGSKGVQDFASLIGNTARQYPAYAQAVAPEIERAAQDALFAHGNTALIEERLEKVHRAVDRLSLGVAGDLHRLTTLQIGRLSTQAAQRKLLQNSLEKEEATYLSVPAYFEPGPPPTIDKREITAALPAPSLEEPASHGPSSENGAPAGDAVLDALERLATLHERGILSDDEFASQKARILQAP